MAAPTPALICKHILRSNSAIVTRLGLTHLFKMPSLNYCVKSKSTDVSQETQGFLKAHAKLEKYISASGVTISKAIEDDATSTKHKTFEELYHESLMVKLGDFSDHVVTAKIIARVGDDIYIDYGGKFNCVCKVPQSQANNSQSNDPYREGQQVIVKVRDHEMTAKFMGYDKDMTLLESDGSLLGLPYQKKE